MEVIPERISWTEAKKILEEIVKIKDSKEFYDRLYEMKEDFLDYEEQSLDIKRFFKNQREHFDKAIYQLEIYEKNRSYVLDQETMKIIDAIEAIIKSHEPYSQIQMLPNLINEFRDKFVQLLQIECKPVRQVIESDYYKLKTELDLVDFKDDLSTKFKAKFDDLLMRLDSANNFYEAIAMKEESDRLKMRCFEEIERKKEEIKKIAPASGDGVAIISGGGETVYKKRKTVTVSMANILHGAKTIETKQDIEKLLVDIRTRLESELQEDTILKLV